MANSILVDTDILIDAAHNVENVIIRLDSEEKDAILSIRAGFSSALPTTLSALFPKHEPGSVKSSMKK